ncbi:MAG TPA: hypothetical protein VNA04_10985 [Thermoanaerobaculia bacterium]|nr:hypothetical protein [Thermoanaerobaculia bacterium]
MRGRVALHILVLMILPALAPATHLGDLYVIPVAGHVRGAHKSLWQTDIAIHNFQSTPITVELAVAESGEGAAGNFFPVTIAGGATVTIPAGGSRILTDVLNDHRGRTDTIGALIVAADAPFAVTSRTYSVDSTGARTVGLTVPPTQEFLSTPAGAAFVPGLVSNTRFRTSIGFTAAASAGAPLVVQVTLLGRDGSTLGSRSFTVPGGAVNHVQFGSATLSAAPFEEGTAVVRILSGPGDVVAYGSVVENSTNQAVFISGVVPGPMNPTITGSTFATLFGQINE